MIVYYLFRLFETIFLSLPKPLQKGFVLALAKLAFFIDAKHKKVIRANLDFTIKDKMTPQHYRSVLKYCHKNLALVLLQVLRSSRISIKELEESVRFENREIIETALKEGKKIILISAHYGNWELGATAISALISSGTAIHKKMNDDYFEEYLMRSRTKFKMKMVEKRGAIKHLVKALREGSSVSVMIDQNIKEREGVLIDFLGKKATQTAAPAFLARKFDALIIPVLIHNRPEKENIITFYEPIITPKTDDEQADILHSTQEQADWLSQAIIEHPEPWFWCHKRFKATHEEIYR